MPVAFDISSLSRFPRIALSDVYRIAESKGPSPSLASDGLEGGVNAGFGREDLPQSTFSRACGCSDKKGRRLVVCIDGTSNQFGDKNTNVIELYRLIKKKKGDNQLTYYDSGIGTYAQPSSKTLAYYKRTFGHKVDLAVAWNFEHIIIGAYRWLSENYTDGDCIFLFGFSRGAYQVRTLSAMIHKVGLIHQGNEAQIPFAYQLYADPDSDIVQAARGSTDAEARVTAEGELSPAQTFKGTFSRDVKVHFVGAWDTVSSIGVVRARKLLPETIDGMNHVCHFRHALALDERRVKFLPEYAYGGDGPWQARSDRPVTNDIKEVWFAGTHSDVGGGNDDNPHLNRTRPSLRWMFAEASAAGLHLEPFRRNFGDVDEIKIGKESLTFAWRVFEHLPFRRLKYNEGPANRHWTDHRWMLFEVIAWVLWMLCEFLLYFLWFSWKLVVDRRALLSLWRRLRAWMFRQESEGQYITERQTHLTDTISWPPHRGKGRIIQHGQKIHTSVWRSMHLTSVTQYSWRFDPFVSAILFCLSALYPNLCLDLLFRRSEPYNPRAYLVLDAETRGNQHSWNHDPFVRVIFLGLSALSALYPNLCLDWLLRPSRPYPPLTWNTLRHSQEHEYSQWKEMDLYDSIDDLIKQCTDHRQVNPENDAQRTQFAMMQIHADSKAGHRALLDKLAARLLRRESIQAAILCNIMDVLLRASDRRVVIAGNESPRRDAGIFTAGSPADVWGLLLHHLRTTATPDQYQLARQFIETYVGDPDAIVEDLVKRCTGNSSTMKGPTGGWSALLAIGIYASSEGGLQLISREVARRLDLETPNDELKPKPMGGAALWRILEVMLKSSYARSVKSCGRYRIVRAQILPYVEGANAERLQIANQFLAQFTDFQSRVLTGHELAVWSVAFSPDGKHIASGSSDETIRIWDAETGLAVGEPVKGHNGDVNSVTFSPNGKHVVSGSDDKTVRIWDVQTGQPVGQPFKGHSDSVWSVAFSPNGERIVSGSDDNTLRIWDAQTGQMVGEPLKGHTGPVYSVAFSPDGTRIVSGSRDSTVRIWDVATGQMVGHPLEGHTNVVFSTAFSPDGKRVISSSSDHTIRIWDVEMGQMVGEPLKGHRSTVHSVAFSPTGKHIVSGSYDKTVRIWDMETRKMVGKPYEGHTDKVMSVAFSPDGKRVVSGSWDSTIRIWDVLEPLEPLAPEIEVRENAEAGPSNAVSPPANPSTIP